MMRGMPSVGIFRVAVLAAQAAVADTRPPVVALPAQATAVLELTVGTDGVGRDCKVLESSGDPKGEVLACRYFSRAGHEIRTDKSGRSIEYQKKFGVALSVLLQLEQAQP